MAPNAAPFCAGYERVNLFHCFPLIAIIVDFRHIIHKTFDKSRDIRYGSLSGIKLVDLPRQPLYIVGVIPLYTRERSEKRDLSLCVTTAISLDKVFHFLCRQAASLEDGELVVSNPSHSGSVPAESSGKEVFYFLDESLFKHLIDPLSNSSVELLSGTVQAYKEKAIVSP